MIYLDTSVALAHLFSETRRPPASFWNERLVASRLLLYEVWTRAHARRVTEQESEGVRALLSEVALVELEPRILARILEPFPEPVRTLDAIHLATMFWLRESGVTPALATYDARMTRVARALGFRVVDLS